MKPYAFCSVSGLSKLFASFFLSLILFSSITANADAPAPKAVAPTPEATAVKAAAPTPDSTTPTTIETAVPPLTGNRHQSFHQYDICYQKRLRITCK